MRLTVDSVLRAEGCPPDLAAALVGRATCPNPIYTAALRQGRSVRRLEPEVTLARREGDVLLLPRGLAGIAATEARRRGLPLEIVDRRLLLGPIPLTFSGTLRPYQAAALRELLRHGSGVLCAPCGSGKSVMGCALIAARRRPALILVHTTDLLAQWVENLRALLGVEPGILGGGRRTFAPVTVGMIQTLGRDPGTLAEAAGRFGLVLLDECHHAPAASFAAVANALPAAFRYGLTATPERADGLAPLMAAVVGPMRATVPPADLEEAGVRVRPVLRWVRGVPCPPLDPSEWVDLVGFLAESDTRNGIILREARALLAEGRTVLILAPRVAQAETLAEALAEGGPSDVGILHGRMRRAERAATLEAVRSGAVRGLVATTVADEGLDLPSLDGLLLASPGRAGGRTEQRIGRIMRSLRGKRVPVVVDLVDDHPVLRSQARGRFFETYRSLCAGAELPEWLRSRGRAA